MRPRRFGTLCLTGLLACSTLKLPLDLQARVDAAPIGGEVLVPAGIWSGDVVIRRPVTIRGAGLGKTTLTGVRTIAVHSPGVTIEALTITGIEAAVRVVSHGHLTARHLRAEGPGKVVFVEEGASLETSDLQVRCDKGGLAGVYVVGGNWKAERVAVTGACRRGVELLNATVDLSRLSILGAREAGFHALTSTLKVTDLIVDEIDKAAPAFFEARSKSDLHMVSIHGGEEALLLRGGDTFVDGLTVTGTSASAVAAIGGNHVVAHVNATGPFQQAALSALVGSFLTATDVTVTAAGSTGLLALRAKVDIDRMTVEQAHSDGDGDNGHGMVLERTEAKLRHLRVTHSDGAAVYASGADSTLDLLGCEGDKVASGVMLALGAQARVGDLHVSNAPMGVVAINGSRLRIGDSTVDALVGMLVCKGSSIIEEPGFVVRADLRRRTCDDENLGAAWNNILTLP